ncbi:MAG TPA: hypothetical protein DCF68_09810 [Cyanothece sp. UBA12306]|nr:hypothetical protein [Cyanothece sp. UBA12306]
MNNLLLKSSYFPFLLIFLTLNFPLKILSQPVPIHTIFEVKGKVTVDKEQWNNPRAAWVGLTLKETDKLEVAANSYVKIYWRNH